MANSCLKASGVVKRFGGVAALDRVDLDVWEGEVVGLIGPNGSGKTTFFNVLTGIYPMTEGKIEFEGGDITNLSAQEIYKSGIARTFQRARLCLELTVFDNIAIGAHPRLNQGMWHNIFNRRVFRKEYVTCRNQVGRLVAQFAPHLLDRLNEPVGGLPMIDRRRVEVCRALISDPRLLLLDEPSAGMTEEETRQLMDEVLAVRDRRDDLSVVIVEHEMGLISRITDRCVVLNFGRKICEGPYAAISQNAEVQEAYLGSEL